MFFSLSWVIFELPFDQVGYCFEGSVVSWPACDLIYLDLWLYFGIQLHHTEVLIQTIVFTTLFWYPSIWQGDLNGSAKEPDTSGVDAAETGEEDEFLSPWTISHFILRIEESMGEMRNSQHELLQLMKAMTEKMDGQITISNNVITDTME